MVRHRYAAALLLASLLFLPGAKTQKAVDLELALGIDVSRSVDFIEGKLQREGYIQAFRDPEVIRAIRHGILGRIAVAYFEWAGPQHTEIVVDWTVIDGAASANAFADKLAKSGPSVARRTSISGAIDFALPWIANNGIEGTRRVIDISGDGPNNWGDLVNKARDRAVAAGVTINGLPILDDGGSRFARYNIPNLDLYYRDCVIGGPGAFLEVAADFKDFARAVRRKLILEIAGRTPPPPAGLVPAQAKSKARISPPCDIGEQILRSRGDF